MLVFKYSKINGAEYISHLDTLRHIQKTFIRAEFNVDYSKGFNPHMRFFMSAPIGVGIRSTSEFCFAEISEDAKEFMSKVNDYCPKGFRVEWATNVNKNPNLAGIIDSALYEIEGEISNDILQEVLSKKELFVIDKHGNEKDVRDKILDLYSKNGKLYAKLSFGNNTLRADILAEKLKSDYGFNYEHITKLETYIKGEKTEDYLIKNFG